ncbi:NAD(P)H-binding protein [Paenibacillus sp. LPE1-1-1.1]|uniref:NAD(P)H-binding protein n=1 Tax=Paenibacillus sp. LPE1-1-1.1 TaxID=3135230 RepID=UPI003425375D
MLNSAFSLDQDKWKESFLKDITDYNIAKHFADQWLINNTNLDYTILQPGVLKETPGSGKLEVNINERW